MLIQASSAIEDPQYVLHIHRNSLELEIMREVKNHTVCILDEKNEKADIQDIVNIHCQHLSKSQQKALLLLVLKFWELVDGTLGNWDTSPVKFLLKPRVAL